MYSLKETSLFQLTVTNVLLSMRKISFCYDVHVFINGDIVAGYEDVDGRKRPE